MDWLLFFAVHLDTMDINNWYQLVFDPIKEYKAISAGSAVKSSATSRVQTCAMTARVYCRLKSGPLRIRSFRFTKASWRKTAKQRVLRKKASKCLNPLPNPWKDAQVCYI